MPEIKADRDDSRGNLAGQGGPQQVDIGEGSDARQAGDRAGLEGAEAGAGDQRTTGGSSRDSDSLR